MAQNRVQWPAFDAPAAQAPGAAPVRLLSGMLEATGVTVRIDPGIIAGWLPRQIRLPEPRPKLYPLLILWGSQQDVCAFPRGGRFPVPWRLSYSEIITAVPGLELAREFGVPGYDRVTYLPRLYMNSWRAALLGRALYGFHKAFARIEQTPETFHAANRHGEPMLSATIEERSERMTDATLSEPPALLPEPLALDVAGRLMLARFEWGEFSKPVRPVSVNVELRPRLLSYLPEFRRPFRGCDEDPDGAFRFRAPWVLNRLV